MCVQHVNLWQRLGLANSTCCVLPSRILHDTNPILSPPCRRVQEVQERLNAVQEELKREVAAAEVARGRAMTVLRRQATLKEVTRPPSCGWWLLAALHHNS